MHIPFQALNFFPSSAITCEMKLWSDILKLKAGVIHSMPTLFFFFKSVLLMSYAGYYQSIFKNVSSGKIQTSSLSSLISQVF